LNHVSDVPNFFESLRGPVTIATGDGTLPVSIEQLLIRSHVTSMSDSYIFRSQVNIITNAYLKDSNAKSPSNQRILLWAGEKSSILFINPVRIPTARVVKAVPKGL